jgi:hypothetical protein
MPASSHKSPNPRRWPPPEGYAENIQHERGDEDFAEQLPVFMHCPQEPGKVEFVAERGKAGPFGNEYQGAIPDLFESFAGEQFGPLRGAFEDEWSSPDNSEQDEKPGRVETCCDGR